MVLIAGGGGEERDCIDALRRESTNRSSAERSTVSRSESGLDRAMIDELDIVTMFLTFARRTPSQRSNLKLDFDGLRVVGGRRMFNSKFIEFFVSILWGRGRVL